MGTHTNVALTRLRVGVGLLAPVVRWPQHGAIIVRDMDEACSITVRRVE